MNWSLAYTGTFHDLAADQRAAIASEVTDVTPSHFRLPAPSRRS